jgi:hypothetical protein
MGGRGSSYGIEVISAKGISAEQGEVIPLHVAGMTPTDQGSRFTNAEKTLKYLESKKMDYDKEQLQVIDRHGYVTRAFQGDEHSVAVDMETRNYMRGKVVTHNHPDTYGGTFSDADISSLRMGMKELRASAKEGNYSMRAMKAADPTGLYKAYEKDSDKLQNNMYQVAKDMAARNWGSYEKYRHENRKAQLQVIHSWYQKNTEKYGYQYSFEPRKDN